MISGHAELVSASLKLEKKDPEMTSG